MPQIIFLPHEDLCPDGAVIEADAGTSICDAALKNGIQIEHACEKSCACTTCHVHIACVKNEDLVIEIPKYTINMVSENH